MKSGNTIRADINLISVLMLRLLPAQVLLAAVGSVNGIVSGIFAGNFVGVGAMSAVGLYAPLNMLMVSVSTVLVGGTVILCGQYMGRNTEGKLQDIFSLDISWVLAIAATFTCLFIAAGGLDLTGAFTRDAAVRPVFNLYLLGQAAGLVPMLAGNVFSSFLSMENRTGRTYLASLMFILTNLVMNVLLVVRLAMGAFGLALASSSGAWVFMLIQAGAFLSEDSPLRIRFTKLFCPEAGRILRIGLPGAASNVYQTARGLAVNRLVEIFVGSVGISAFAASDSVMRIFWSLPIGMLAVSRMMISVSAGEEDRQSLADIMRVMFRRYIPIMCAVCAVIMLCAHPFARLFYQDTSSDVYMMTVWGFRILPLCMPLSIICMHFSCWYQVSGRQAMVHILALLDGVVSVVFFTAVLIGSLGMNSVYIANVLNGTVTTVIIVGYAALGNRRMPKNMEELMVMPEGLGVAQDMRLDISVDTAEEVVTIAERLQEFCLARGIDEKRSYIAALCMEEMAGNIVEHGFTKDTKNHSIDIRAAVKESDVILRIRDDCVAFDPYERKELSDGSDPVKNIGIRLVYSAASDVAYRNILGMNVLTIRI